MPRDLQTSLSGGELAPSLHSHADLTKHRTGLALCKNWFALAQGGITTRPGFKFIYKNIDDSVARLIPFQFNTEQTYVLVFTDQAMRVIKDGGAVLEGAQNITAITKASPAQVTVTGHGLSTGDEVYIASVGGMTELNGRFFEVTVVDANNFTLDGIDSSGYTTYTSGGTAARVYKITTPYAAADLFRLKYVQSADVMTITHPDYQQRELTRTDHDAWALSAITYQAGIDPPSSISITDDGSPPGGTHMTHRYVVTSVNADGVESGPSSVAAFNTEALTTEYGIRLSWSTVTGAEYYKVYHEQSDGAGIYGFISEVDEDGSPSMTDFNLGPDLSETPPQEFNPFDGADDYPSCTTYHQQRLVFGATNNNPQTVWMTRSGDFDNMDRSRPSRDDDSIDATLASRQVNEIRHLVSIDDLIALTSGGVWKIEGDQDGVITPSNLNFRTQGAWGCSHVRPLVIGETALFIQDKGSRIRDLAYTFELDRYAGNDLTILARHFFEGKEVVDWDYAAEPYGIVWAVRNDGVLLALTYLKEQQVFAWSQHHTEGEFESVSVISEGDEDAVYAVVKRTINGSNVRYIERLNTRIWDDIEDHFAVDAGLTYEGTSYAITGATQANPVVITANSHGHSNGDVVYLKNISGMTELNGRLFTVANATANTFELQDIDGTSYSAYVSGGESRVTTTTITNLHHLEGETLVALGDGNVMEDLTVSNGEVTLPIACSKVHIGLGYNCDFQTLEVSFQGDVVQGRKKQVSTVSLRVLESRGLAAGRSATDAKEFKERSAANGYGNIDPITAQQTITITPKWNDFGQVFVRQRYPLPATVLAVVPEIVVSG